MTNDERHQLPPPGGRHPPVPAGAPPRVHARARRSARGLHPQCRRARPRRQPLGRRDGRFGRADRAPGGRRPRARAAPTPTCRRRRRRAASACGRRPPASPPSPRTMTCPGVVFSLDGTLYCVDLASPRADGSRAAAPRSRRRSPHLPRRRDVQRSSAAGRCTSSRPMAHPTPRLLAQPDGRAAVVGPGRLRGRRGARPRPRTVVARPGAPRSWRSMSTRLPSRSGGSPTPRSPSASRTRTATRRPGRPTRSPGSSASPSTATGARSSGIARRTRTWPRSSRTTPAARWSASSAATSAVSSSSTCPPTAPSAPQASAPARHGSPSRPECRAEGTHGELLEIVANTDDDCFQLVSDGVALTPSELNVTGARPRGRRPLHRDCPARTDGPGRLRHRGGHRHVPDAGRGRPQRGRRCRRDRHRLHPPDRAGHAVRGAPRRGHGSPSPPWRRLRW